VTTKTFPVTCTLVPPSRFRCETARSRSAGPVASWA
jgi:hypothetical protein